MNTLRTFSFIVMVLTFGCTTASNADKYTPVNCTLNQSEIEIFLSLYNEEHNAAIRQTPQPLHLTAFNGEDHSFSAILCEIPADCTKEELSQNESQYILFNADINNDATKELTLVAIGQGSDLGDVVLGVYQRSNKKLIELPFVQVINTNLGENALKEWPTRISLPFVTQYNDEYYMNFENRLVWKNKNGNALSPHQLNKADIGTIEHHRYLWKGNSIRHIESFEQSIKRQNGP